MAGQHTVLETQAGQAVAEVRKAGQGAPLVYLHGAFGYQGWPPFLDHLAESFTVYAPLHPGFGERDGIEAIDDVLDLTLYHLDLLDGLGLDAPAVVGHHLGAMIAAEMAAVCPHSVGRLVLAAPTGLWLDEHPGVDYFATPAGELRSVLFRDPDAEAARAAMPEPQSDGERGAQAVERVRSLSTAGKFLWPIPDRGLSKRLYRIQAPTLVMVAEDDKVVPPAYGDEFSQRIPNARLHLFKNAGHLFMLERPEEFSGAVADFLRS